MTSREGRELILASGAPTDCCTLPLAAALDGVCRKKVATRHKLVATVCQNLLLDRQILLSLTSAEVECSNAA